jgi:D-alanine-D-alanine ligase
LELNPLPGILPKPEDNSCFPKSARAAGMSYSELVQTVLHLAAQRHGILNRTPAGESPAAPGSQDTNQAKVA